MKLYDISQIPVLENGKVIGIVDEWDLLIATQKSRRTILSTPCAPP